MRSCTAGPSSVIFRSARLASRPSMMVRLFLARLRDFSSASSPRPLGMAMVMFPLAASTLLRTPARVGPCTRTVVANCWSGVRRTTAAAPVVEQNQRTFRHIHGHGFAGIIAARGTDHQRERLFAGVQFLDRPGNRGSFGQNIVDRFLVERQAHGD